MKISKRKGFTLIELLVVVLIIGILSAIALPQYQKAVARSRLAGLIQLASAIAQAEQVYYAANGEYTIDAENLDVALPGGFVKRSETAGKSIEYRKDFVSVVFYAMGYGGAERVSVHDSRVPAFVLWYFDPKKSSLCGVEVNSAQVELGKSICTTYGVEESNTGGGKYFYYKLNF